MTEIHKDGTFTNTENKLRKDNWRHHAEAHNDFSRQDHFLQSSFLYCLPSQRPFDVEASTGSLFQAQDMKRLPAGQFEKAWKHLSGFNASLKSYVKPGKSLAPQNHDGAKKAVLSNSTYANNRFSAHPYRAENSEAIHHSVHSNQRCDSFPRQLSTNTQMKRSLHAMPTDMEDDDILENIDVDQIVMEHYQSSCTQPLMSDRSPLAPIASGPDSPNAGATFLPPELCCMCTHGCKLGVCSEKENHLREMKDMLIGISNELLDHVADLTPVQLTKLRENRVQISKQIEQLEKYPLSISAIEKQHRSDFVATPAHVFGVQDDNYTNIDYKSNLTGFCSEKHAKIDPGEICMSPLPRPSFSTNDCPPSDFTNRETYIPKNIEVNYIEGSGDQKWSSVNFSWTKKLEANNKKVFGNHSFRPNQREIINATMSGNDVFVLMPTGGGKSLTYQLPALICPGITLVVSPLVSLIQDQIMHLMQVNIPAAYLSASMEWTEQQAILRDVSSDNCKFKLLYATPEKIAKSDVLLRHLESLYARELLSRIVIDEAHCVSQWGHDFRPDYQALGILKKKFPKSPVLALTATATASVKEDVVQALGLVNCVVFRQSFNRPNLWYCVVPKTKKCVEDIDKFIRENHFDECGIIYCLSRMDCEKVAERLQECGHKAAFYHSNMDPAQRVFVQKQWSKDEINIICATVAFGMGINKPDVRFVIHHSLPKSIEGYHQECGRAGRDGLRSSCVLYYTYSDYIRMKHMVTQGTFEQVPAPKGSFRVNGRVRETNTENLLRMVSYCEDDVDCRRFLQLLHFGEKFDSSACRKTCDNCCKSRHSTEKDVTSTAKQLVELVMMTGQQFSSTHVLDVYRGSLSQYVKKHKHNSLSLHGAGKHLPKDQASRILRHLVVEDIIFEDVKKSDLYGSVTSVLKVNPSPAHKVCSGVQRITIRLPCSERQLKLAKSHATPLGKESPTPLQGAAAATPASHAQPEVDLTLAAKLYSALRILRTALVREAGEGVMAYHIFGNATLQQISKRIPRTNEELLEINGIGKAKVSKYGDRLLEVIEMTIGEHCGGSNDSLKRRRRGFTGGAGEGIPISSFEEDDDASFSGDFQPRKFKKNKDTDSAVEDCPTVLQLDDEEEGCIDFDLPVNQDGRMLPSWPNASRIPHKA